MDDFTDNAVVCPECDVQFMVVWANDGFSLPEFCPFCGVQMDYGPDT